MAAGQALVFLSAAVPPKALSHIWRDRITWEQLVNELDQKMQFPGVSNAWTMPIKARIDMLTTGVRTPIGIKVYGADLKEIEKIGTSLETILRDVQGTRSIFAERVTGGYFVDFDIRREDIARYGLTIKEVEMIIMSAIGGEPVTTTVEGRERYTVNVRYARELRDDLDKLAPRARPDHVRRPDPARAAGRHPPDSRTVHAPGRERHARRVRLCRYHRPRHRELCGRSQEDRRARS